MGKLFKKEIGITLISLVITIVVLIILASVAINMTLGENGIFTKAKEAKKAQIIAEAKEKIGLEILNAQIEATEKNEEVQQTKIENIVSKYGELQADGDTIKLKDSGYEISLAEIYNGTTSNSGGNTGNTELDNLKAELAKTNATSAQILKDYKAYSNGQLITGTMENYAGITQDATATTDDTYTYLSIPNAGYYGTDSKLRMEKDKLAYVIPKYIYVDESSGNYISYTKLELKNVRNINFTITATSDYPVRILCYKNLNIIYDKLYKNNVTETLDTLQYDEIEIRTYYWVSNFSKIVINSIN